MVLCACVLFGYHIIEGAVGPPTREQALVLQAVLALQAQQVRDLWASLLLWRRLQRVRAWLMD